MTARYHYQSPDIPSMGADRWWLKAKQGKAGWSRWSPGLSLLSLAPLAPLEIGQLLTRPAHTRVGIVGRVRTIRQNPPDLRFSYFSSLLNLIYVLQLTMNMSCNQLHGNICFFWCLVPCQWSFGQTLAPLVWGSYVMSSGRLDYDNNSASNLTTTTSLTLPVFHSITS